MRTTSKPSNLFSFLSTTPYWLVGFASAVFVVACPGEQPKTLEDLLNEQGGAGDYSEPTDLNVLLPNMKGESEVSSAPQPNPTQEGLMALLPSRSMGAGAPPPIGRQPQVPTPTNIIPPNRNPIPNRTPFAEEPNYSPDTDSLMRIQSQYRSGQYEQVLNYFEKDDFLAKQYYHAMSLYCLAIDIGSPEEKARQVGIARRTLRQIALQTRNERLRGKAALWNGILNYLHPSGLSLRQRLMPFEFIHSNMRGTSFHNDALLYAGLLHHQVGEFAKARMFYMGVMQSPAEDLIYDVNVERFVLPHKAAEHYLGKLSERAKPKPPSVSKVRAAAGLRAGLRSPRPTTATTRTRQKPRRHSVRGVKATSSVAKPSRNATPRRSIRSKKKPLSEANYYDLAKHRPSGSSAAKRKPSPTPKATIKPKAKQRSEATQKPTPKKLTPKAKQGSEAKQKPEAKKESVDGIEL